MKINAGKIVGEWQEITTQLLDRHNDNIQIYVQQRDDGYILTDDGYTINDLEISGCCFDTPEKNAMLDAIINYFGAKRSGDTIEIKAELEETVALNGYNLVQAIFHVNNLLYTVQAKITEAEYEI